MEEQYYMAGINSSLFINQSEFVNNTISQVGNGGAVFCKWWQ